MDCLLLKSDPEKLASGNDELIDEWAETPGRTIWVGIEGPLTDSVEACLEDRFGIHPLALQDARRDRHPPKFESFGATTFLLFKVLSSASAGIDFRTVQLAIFTGPGFLITRLSGPSRCIDQLRSEIVSDPAPLGEGTGKVAARLIRLLIDEYLAVLLDLEPRLERLEAGLLEPAKNDAVLVELTGYKTDLKRMRRILHYQEQILDRLRRESFADASTELAPLLNDIYEQQERAASLTLLYYELASDLVDGYLSMASHRLNGIMKILTIVTAIFVPLGFLAGIYGMNFENMPELGSRAGYFILLGVMATVAASLLLVFRLKKWIGS